MVDKFKAEVVRNYALLIDKVEQEDGLVLNQGAVRWDGAGNLRYSKTSERERIFSSGYYLTPAKLVAGTKSPMNYEVQHKYADGRTAREIAKGSMLVKGQETVRTPAGEFKAWRVEIDVLAYFENVAGTTNWSFVGWYVPELRAYVAYDDEARNSNGSFSRRDRHELTSFQVRGADNLAQR